MLDRKCIFYILAHDRLKEYDVKQRQMVLMKGISKKGSRKGPEGIEINRDWCKGCGICVAFCPKDVLALDEEEKAVIKEREKCNYCGLCELRCPDIAIELK